MKTVKTLFMFVSIAFVVIALGGCDAAQQMVAPLVEDSGGDTTTPPIETPANGDDAGGEEVPPIETDAGDDDAGDDDTGGEEVPPVETDDGGNTGDGDTVEPPPPVVPEGPVVSILPASATSPAVGEQLTVEIQVAGAENVFGYEFTLMFDAAALRYVESANGAYLSGAFFTSNLKNDNQIRITAGAGAASEAESGTLASVTFEVISRQASTLTLVDVALEHGGSRSEPQVVNAEISE